MNIRKLNIDDLQRSEEVYGYYQNHYQFSCIIYKDGKFKNIPILKETSQYFESKSQNIPKEYIEGFIYEYSKPLPNIKNKSDRKWLLRFIQPNPIIYSKDYFELGCKTAEAFKVWEYIISDLPKFEEFFMPKIQVESDMKPTSIELIRDLGDVIAGTYYGSIPTPSKLSLIIKGIKDSFKGEFKPDTEFIRSVEILQPFYTLIAEQVILRGKWLTNKYNINKHLFIPDNPGLLMQSAIFLIPLNQQVSEEILPIAQHFKKCYDIIHPIVNELCEEMILKKDNPSFLFLPEEKKIINNSETTSKLSHREVAFICHYEGIILNLKLANEKLKKYNLSISPTSGKQLMDAYNQWNTPRQRTADNVKTEGVIRKILPLLSDEAKKVANNELGVAINNQNKKREE